MADDIGVIPPPPAGFKIRQGLVEPGNIDLYERPKIPNPQGGTSTVFSMSFEENGQEILVPRAADGRILSEKEAIDRYRKTRQHLGKFKTSQDADSYAQSLHQDYASGKYDKRPAKAATGPYDPDKLKNLMERGDPRLGADIAPLPPGAKLKEETNMQDWQRIDRRLKKMYPETSDGVPVQLADLYKKAKAEEEVNAVPPDLVHKIFNEPMPPKPGPAQSAYGDAYKKLQHEREIERYRQRMVLANGSPKEWEHVQKQMAIVAESDEAFKQLMDKIENHPVAMTWEMILGPVEPVQMSGIKGYPKIAKGIYGAATAPTSEEAFKHGTEAIGGVGEALTPLTYSMASLNPATLAKYTLGTEIASNVAEELSKHMGATEEEMQFISSTSGLVGGLVLGIHEHVNRAGVVHRDLVQELQNRIQEAPAEARRQVAKLAQNKVAESLLERKRVIGPDGKVYQVKSKTEAQRLAKKWIRPDMQRVIAGAKEGSISPLLMKNESRGMALPPEPAVEKVSTGESPHILDAPPPVDEGVLDVPVLDAGERELLRQQNNEREAMELLQRERAQRAVEVEDQLKRIKDKVQAQREHEERMRLPITDRRSVRPAGSDERHSELMGRIQALNDRMAQIAEEQLHVSPDDMVRSLLEKKPRGVALKPHEKEVLKLWDERKRLTQMPTSEEVDPAENRRRVETIEREQKLRDAARLLDRQAAEATTPDEVQALGERADEAARRAEELKTQADQEKADAEASKQKVQEYPVGPPVSHAATGKATEVRLPDGRKIAAKYAVVRAEDLVISHSPDSFQWNPQYEPRRMQPRDYEKNKEAQAGVIAGGQNFEPNAVHNTDDTGHNGPPVILSDGRVAGGNGRSMRYVRAYKHGDGEALRQHLVDSAGMFGIDPGSIPPAEERPVLVRVLDDSPEGLADLINLGQDLNRTETRGFTQAEQSVMSAERLSPATMEWVSRAIDAAGDDASIRDVMRDRGGELVAKLLEDGMFDPTKRAQFVTAGGELTEDAKRLLENAIMGKVISDADLIATMPPSLKTKLFRSLATLAKIKVAEPKWDFTDYLQEAVRNWKRMEAVGAPLDAFGKKGASQPEKWYAYQDGKMIKEPEDHPAVKALTLRLDDTGKDLKKAFDKYADEIEGTQEGLSFKAPAEPLEAFNQHIAEKAGVEVKPEEWGSLRPVADVPEVEDADHLKGTPDDELRKYYAEVRGIYGDDDPITQQYAQEMANRGLSEEPEGPVTPDVPPPLPGGPQADAAALTPPPERLEDVERKEVGKKVAESVKTDGPMTEAKLREILGQHPAYSTGKISAAVDIWKRFAEKYLGVPFDQWLGEKVAGVEVMGAGPEAQPAGSVPTGILFQPFGEGHEDAIKAGGGIPVGVQEGFRHIPAHALFNDPITKSTLMLPLDQVTADSVRERIAESRKRFGVPPPLGEKPLYQNEYGAGMAEAELASWVKAAGRRLRIEAHGQQLTLFGPPENVYKLKNRSGESVLVTQTQMDALGLRAPDQGSWNFEEEEKGMDPPPAQGTLFQGEEVNIRGLGQEVAAESVMQLDDQIYDDLGYKTHPILDDDGKTIGALIYKEDGAGRATIQWLGDLELQNTLDNKLGPRGLLKIKNDFRRMHPDIKKVDGVRIGGARGADVLTKTADLHQGAKGAVQFLEDGRALIHLMENADISTVMHEFAHVARRNLKPEDRGIVEKWLKVEDGVWGTDHEEKFARVYERYLYDGEAPTPEVKPIFARIRDWMMEVYETVKKSAIDIKIPNNVREVFDRMASGVPEDLAKTADNISQKSKSWTADRGNLEKSIDREAKEIQDSKDKAGESLTPEERLSSTKIAEGGEPLSEDMPDAKFRIFDAAQDAMHWAKTNGSKIKGAAIYQMADGRAFAHFVPRGTDVLFQETDPLEIDRRIRLIDERMKKVLSDPERAKLGKMRQELMAQRTQKPPAIMEPPPGAPALKLWTPEGEIEIGGPRETSKTPRIGETEQQRGESDVPPEFQKPVPASGLPKEAKRPDGSKAPGTAARGLGGPGGRGAGAGKGEQPRKSIPDVPATRVDAPIRDRGEVVYEASDWKERLGRLGLPTNAPAPTVRLPQSVKRMLWFPGQAEIVESALSGLKQHDAYIIASPTGSGKSYTQAALVSQLHKPGMKTLVLTTNKELIHQRGNGLIPVYRDFDVDLQELPPGVSDPGEGVFVTTYSTGIGRDIAQTKWDLIVADEIGQARRWYAANNRSGMMMKEMANNAGKVLYLSATPFHTALELGHMDKMGLWNKMGFAEWGKQFGIYTDTEGNWAGGNAPKKLLKLREELIERGQMIDVKKNLEGFDASFAQVKQTKEQEQAVKNINRAFTLAEDYFQRKGKKSMVRAVRANQVTYIKKYLERSRLPQAIELGRKLEAEGWKVIFFSETRAERTDVFDFLKQADEDLGGEISELLPPLSGVGEALQAEFGDSIANYSGPHSAARSAAKDAFNDDGKKHIDVSYAAGGIGVSLHDTAGDKPRAVIYLGPPYSGVMFDQAIGRAWRYGTKSNVHAIFLTSNARPEIDMILTKIAPRMTSLRALVSGIDTQDTFVNTLRNLDRVREEQAGYELGQNIKFDAREFEGTENTHAIQDWQDVKIGPATEAMHKGMKMPDMEAPAGVIKLFQDDEMEPPDDFRAPKGREADDENRFQREQFEQGRPLAGAGADDMPTGARVQASDMINARAREVAENTEDGKVGAVRGQWKQDRGFLGTVYDRAKGSRVARAAKAIDLYMFTHGRKVIRRVSADAGAPAAGQQIARMVPDYHVVWGNTAGPWVKRYFDIMKANDISKGRKVRYKDPKTGEMKETDEHHNMVMAKEGKQPPANPRIAQAVRQVTELFQDVKNSLGREGVATEIFEGGSRRFVPFSEQMDDPGYWPRKYDLDYEIKSTDPESGEVSTVKLRDLIGDRMGEATRERFIKSMMNEHGLARAQVEDFLASRHRDHPLVGNVERARQYDMPWYRTDINVAVEYLEGAGEAVARTRVFGQRRQKLERAINQIPEVRARAITREVMDSLLAGRYMQDDTRAMMGVIANWSVMTKMGFSAVKALGHSAWAPLSSNTRSYLRGLFEGVTDYRESRERAMVSGAVLEQYKTAALKEFGTKTGSIGSKFLGWVQFHRAYEFGRIVSDATARVYLERYALEKLKTNKSADYYRRNLKEVYLLDDKTIDAAIETGSWTEDDLNRAGKALADKTMFTNDPTELPPAWRARSDNEVADFTLSAVRAVTLLKGYSLKTGAMLRERLIDEARKGNMRPWIPFLLLSPAIGEAITQFNRLFATKKKEEAEKELSPGGVMWGIAEDVGHMTGWSTMEMMLELIANPGSHGRMDIAKTAYEFFLGPFVSDLAHTVLQLPYELMNAKTDLGRDNALRRWVRGTLPMTKPFIDAPKTRQQMEAPPE